MHITFANNGVFKTLEKLFACLKPEVMYPKFQSRERDTVLLSDVQRTALFKKRVGKDIEISRFSEYPISVFLR